MSRAMLAPYTPGASRRLLVRLAAAGGRVVTYDALLHAIYADAPEGGPENALGVLRVLITKWRRRLPAGAIINQHGVGYQLAPEAVPEWARREADDCHVMLARSPADARRFAELRAG